MNSIENKLKSFFFDTIKLKLNRCLAPGMKCNKRAIKAHSVQNSNVLELLCHDDHVKKINIRFDAKKGPVVFFDDVGRKKATTFTGFCSIHDSDIFRPIENNPFDPQNNQHLFLVAYRSVVRELHAVMEGASKVQSGYLNQANLGLVNGNEPSEAAMLGLQHMLKAYHTYNYKCIFDKAIVSESYDNIEHRVFMISNEQPTIAVSSLFALDNTIRNDDWVRVTLNVFPITGFKTIVVISFIPEDSKMVRANLDRILGSHGYHQKYELSKIILNNCENFVVSPKYYDSWSSKKKEIVTNYFINTLFQGDLTVESEHLYLF